MNFLKQQDTVSKIQALLTRATTHLVGNTLIDLETLAYWALRPASNDPMHHGSHGPAHVRHRLVRKRKQKRPARANFFPFGDKWERLAKMPGTPMLARLIPLCPG